MNNPCLNGGTCEDDVNGYQCACMSGYSGYSCGIGEFSKLYILHTNMPWFHSPQPAKVWISHCIYWCGSSKALHGYKWHILWWLTVSIWNKVKWNNNVLVGLRKPIFPLRKYLLYRYSCINWVHVWFIVVYFACIAACLACYFIHSWL